MKPPKPPTPGVEHKPTAKTRERVELLAGFGIPQTCICREIGINDKTLAKHYRKELDNGVDKANSQVIGALFKNAMSGQVAAQIFWAKTRCHWKEVSVVENTGNPSVVILPANGREKAG